MTSVPMNAPGGAERCLVMGVVNVTPDSFSDGGGGSTPKAAIAPRPRPVAEGADIVDVGGESTRPGAARVSLEEELAPGRSRSSGRWPRRARSSASTPCAPRWREAALEAGAAHGQRRERRPGRPAMMPRVVAAAGAAVRRDALARPQPRHAAAAPSTTTWWPRSRDELRKRVDAVLGRGRRARSRSSSTPASVSPRTPSTTGRCWPRSRELTALGHPLLVGASRKRFLGRLLADADGDPGRSTARRRDTAPSRRSPRTPAPGACASTRCAPTPTPCAWPPHGERAGAADDERRQPQRHRARLNQEFYAAFESGDLDRMTRVWAEDSAADRWLRASRLAAAPGRSEVLRSWALIMANTTYIQFVLTDVDDDRDRRRRPS